MKTLRKTNVTELQLLRLIQGLNCLENAGFIDIQYIRHELEIHYNIVKKRKIKCELITKEI